MDGHKSCLSCGGSLQSLDQSYHYLECGLPNVYLEGVQSKCEQCGEIEVTIPNVPGLHRAIGDHVIRYGSLTPAELRFLRKSARLTQEQLANEMEINRSTINRWETADEKVWSKSEDFLIRVIWVQHMYGLRDELDALKNQLFEMVRRAKEREDIRINLADIRTAA